MNVCRIHLSAPSVRLGRGGAVGILGNFDGLHRGHQALFSRACEVARGLPVIALSLYPHPAIVLGRADSIPRLTSIRQKIQISDALGVSTLGLVRFTHDVAKLSAERFVTQVLIGIADITHLVIGPDAAVGHDRKGTAEAISAMMASAGRSCEVVPFLSEGAERISSRRIRKALSDGDLPLVARCLGRPYALDGRVVHGAARGRTIGIPTMNLSVRGRALPPHGVYRTLTRIGVRRYDSITNIGVRPTVDGSSVRMETHLLDFEGGDCYRKYIEVELHEFIRPERRFGSIGELQKQIRADLELVRTTVQRR